MPMPGCTATRPAYRYTVEDSVYVAPDMHRRGVGLVLLKALVEAATARGFRQMIAVIGDSAQAASIGLHLAAVSITPAIWKMSVSNSAAGSIPVLMQLATRARSATSRATP